MSVDVITFGCRLNAVESEVIRREARSAGLADTIVVNTCAVTAEAVRQAHQAIRRAARERPEAKIVVTGCAAQIEPQLFARMPEVALVAGNAQKLRPGFWREYRDDQLMIPPGIPGGAVAPEDKNKVAVSDIMAVSDAAPHLVDRFTGRARATVQVQNGCDHRCTFCIIPYGRGRSRSLPMGAVVAEVRALVEHGYREVVLTGVDLTSYGADLPGASRLGTLVKQILRHVPELPRLRLSSIDAAEADHDLLDAFGSDARLMPHLHLSLQAGDDLILKRMKRRHRRADAIAFCDAVRRLRPDVIFGADIIAGFPTESEAMFARSLELIDECGLTHLHVFPFSPRPGTPAARMPQVARAVVKERARRLRAKGQSTLRAHLDAQVGATRRVLAERGQVGHTEHFTPVRLSAPVAPGTIIDLAISGHDGRRLLAD